MPGRGTRSTGLQQVCVSMGSASRWSLTAVGYGIADNRTGELSTWDVPTLETLISALPEGMFTGFETGELDELFGEGTSTPAGQGDAAPQVDRAAELATEWGVEAGQVWELPARRGGWAHRVMCGSSTQPASVEQLLAGGEPRLMVTDPPYGVEYDPAWRGKALNEEAEYRLGVVAGDDRADWRRAFGLFPGDITYVWHGSLHAATVQRALESVSMEIRSQIVWVKPRLAISRGHYHWQHEVCWYAVREGAKAHWIGDKKQSTVWELSGDDTVDGGHATQKPLEAMARPLRNHEGDVFDPFLGSGTTLVAAENEGRRCWGMEIEAGYVGVVLQRYLDAFGIRGELCQ